jgi:thymidylate synthase ThyX
MKVESKLILSSKNSVTGVNLYTFVLTYPRVILAEVNTHRMLSRNTASSRAIPSKKQRDRVLNDPFVPISIGANQKGMQAGAELEGWRRTVAINTWKLARYPMVLASWILDKVGAHKQVVNRIVEPWTWTQQIVTCTDLKNVFKLRNHTDAEPHFHELARQMQAQVELVERIYNTDLFEIHHQIVTGTHYNVALGAGIYTVQILKPGEWHMPFIDEKDTTYRRTPTIGMPDATFNTNVEVLKRVSTARCARVSYYLPENGQRSDASRDLELCGRLSSSGHWSPFEHVATPTADDTYFGNFRSWKQYRKEFEEEHGGDR